MGGSGSERFLHDGPTSLAIWRATPYCHANVVQLWSSLSKTRDVASLWWYGASLSRAGGHPASQIPGSPPTPFPPNKRIPILGPGICGPQRRFTRLHSLSGKISGVNKSAGSESAARICPRKSPPKRGLWESYFLQGMIGKTHTQNLQILREDTLGATCSAGPFLLTSEKCWPRKKKY